MLMSAVLLNADVCGTTESRIHALLKFNFPTLYSYFIVLFRYTQ